MVTKEQAIDILDKFDFFQGQRAGRELWNGKPFDVQEKDIADFSRDVALLKEYISDVAPKSEVEKWYHEYHVIKDALKQEKDYNRHTEKLTDKYFNELQVAKSEVERLEKELVESYKKLDESMDFTCVFGQPHKVSNCPIDDEVAKAKAEVIEEYRKKVYSRMEKYTVFGREYIQRIMREVEKEMVGDKNA